MQEHYLDNDRIYYRTNEFKPDRLTLVFVHGVSGSSSAWMPYEKIFENKYNILTYDIRGHGLSKKYPKYADYAIENFANDLEELLKYLQIKKFILITNSFGGLIGLKYIEKHQDNILENIMTSPEIFLNEGTMGKITRPIFWLITQIVSILPWNPKPRGHVDYSKYINVSEWDIRRNWADMSNTGLRAHMYTLRHSFKKEQEYALQNISVPTLIIHGEKDGMVPVKNILSLKEKIPNAEMIIIPNATHDSARNNSKEISEAIESFIDKNKANFKFS
ncbi:MAG: alpha/beta hydrolase [Candidatus Pacebacteria bacterium]|nr:alpha/beta hydrolase [Candidatus Paceibacterota bacterium]